MAPEEEAVFAEMVAGMNFEEGEPENYRALKNDELMAAWLAAKETLLNHGAARHSTEEEDIDLLARYQAMSSELERRGLR